MRVCFIPCLSDLAGGGRSLVNMLIGLQNTEVDPIVVLGRPGPIEMELKKQNIPYWIIPFCGAVKSKSFFKTVIKRLSCIISPLLIEGFLKSKQIDIVHTSGFLADAGMLAAKRAQVPYVCHIREFVQEDHQLEFFNEQKQLSLLKDADYAIAISKCIYQKFSKLAPTQRFITLYNGIDILDYLDEGHEVFDCSHVSILMVGRISPTKGQLEALQTINILKKRGILNFTFKLVGANFSAQGQERTYLTQIKEYISSNQLSQVELIPFTNDLKELRSLRAGSDINLICSEAEAMGRVTIESQLAGCLTIGANAGATPELIQDKKTGLLYEAGDPKDLANKIVYAINHVEEMREIAKSGQQYAKKAYDSRTYGKKILNLYKRILQERSSIESPQK